VVYAAYLHTGRLWLPSMNLPSVSWFSGTPKLEPVGLPVEPTWRWRENGKWHYGDSPPKGVKAERIDRSATEE
jgi:hypothetical protein